MRTAISGCSSSSSIEPRSTCGARFYRGALTCAESGDAALGLRILSSAMAELEAIDQKLRKAHFLGILAQALAANGRLAEARAAIESAHHVADAQGEHWWRPELLRIDASLRIADARPREAEALLVGALAAAEGIGALSWKLRAAIDLAVLWHAEGRADAARDMLRPVHGAFAEGHGTGDLRQAARLLAAQTEEARGG